MRTVLSVTLLGCSAAVTAASVLAIREMNADALGVLHFWAAHAYATGMLAVGVLSALASLLVLKA